MLGGYGTVAACSEWPRMQRSRGDRSIVASRGLREVRCSEAGPLDFGIHGHYATQCNYPGSIAVQLYLFAPLVL